MCVCLPVASAVQADGRVGRLDGAPPREAAAHTPRARGQVGQPRDRRRVPKVGPADLARCDQITNAELDPRDLLAFYPNRYALCSPAHRDLPAGKVNGPEDVSSAVAVMGDEPPAREFRYDSAADTSKTL